MQLTPGRTRTHVRSRPRALCQPTAAVAVSGCGVDGVLRGVAVTTPAHGVLGGNNSAVLLLLPSFQLLEGVVCHDGHHMGLAWGLPTPGV